RADRREASGLLVRDPYGGRAAVDLELRGLLQGAAVPLEDPHFFLDHVADQDRAAVGRERGALRPVADRRLGHLAQLAAADAQQDEVAVVVEERRLPGLVAAVHRDDRDERAVRRELDAFGCLTDGDRVHYARRIRAEIDQARGVGV